MLHPEGCFQPLCDIKYGRSAIISKVFLLKWFRLSEATLALIVSALLSKWLLQTPNEFLFYLCFWSPPPNVGNMCLSSCQSLCCLLLLAGQLCLSRVFLEDASAMSNKKSDSDLKTKIKCAEGGWWWLYVCFVTTNNPLTNRRSCGRWSICIKILVRAALNELTLLWFPVASVQAVGHSCALSGKSECVQSAWTNKHTTTWQTGAKPVNPRANSQNDAKNFKDIEPHRNTDHRESVLILDTITRRTRGC